MCVKEEVRCDNKRGRPFGRPLSEIWTNFVSRLPANHFEGGGGFVAVEDTEEIDTGGQLAHIHRVGSNRNRLVSYLHTHHIVEGYVGRVTADVEGDIVGSGVRIDGISRLAVFGNAGDSRDLTGQDVLA